MDALQADRFVAGQDSVSVLCLMTFLRHVREGPALYLFQAQQIIIQTFTLYFS
jgi:hypothetical protein